MTVHERLLFVRQLRSSFTSVGAILPTSRIAARAMTSELARRRTPQMILEAGSGTGAITAAIVAQMGPDDRLVLVERDAAFVAYLHQRFQTEPAFARVRDQVTVLHTDVTQLDPSYRFDTIVSAIPFTNLPAAVIEAILEAYRTMLKPDGTVTYIEYALLRKLKRPLLSAPERQRFDQANAVLDRWLHVGAFRHDFVWRNVPPAWIHHLRLRQPDPAAALTLAPLTHSRRIPLPGGRGVATEALPWVGSLLAAALLLPRRLRGLWLLLAAAVTAFFRDPQRTTVPDPDAVYAAADGRVLAVERLVNPRFGTGEWLRISVFLSLLDVHINRSPIAGRVGCIISEAGGYAAADHPAAEHNYTQYTLIDGAHWPCIVAQRVGLVARRIVNWSAPNLLLAQGDRFGLIRFGSRTDVYVPADQCVAVVQPGDRVVGGETVIARRITT